MKPESMDQLGALTTQNLRVEGYGLDVVTVLPCPFCAAPDWARLPILTTPEAMKTGATCGSCGRGAKAEFTDFPNGGYQFELVQTSGPDQPDWMAPKMRRVGN